MPQKKRKPQSAPSNTYTHVLLAIAFIALFAASEYAIFVKPPQVAFYNNLLVGLGGGLSMLLPFGFAWAAYLAIRRAIRRPVGVGRAISHVVLFTLVYTFVELLNANDVLVGTSIHTFLNFVTHAYSAGIGGGAYGALLAFPIYRYLGVGIGVFVLLCAIAITLVVNGTLPGFVRFLTAHAPEKPAPRPKDPSDGKNIPSRDPMGEEMMRGKKPAPHKESIHIAPEPPAEPTPEPKQRARKKTKDEMDFDIPLNRRKPVTPVEEEPDPFDEIFPETSPKKPRRAKDTDADDSYFDIAEDPIPAPKPRRRPDTFTDDTYTAPEPEPNPEPKKKTPQKPKPSFFDGDDDLTIEPDEYEFPEAEEKPKAKPKKEPKIKKEDLVMMPPSEEYAFPDIELLKPGKVVHAADNRAGDREKAQLLEETLQSFGIQSKLTGIAHGPAVTRFELQPAPGVKVARITALSDDIALKLAAMSVRIEAPIPGKPAVGVEIPNDKIETVNLRDVLESSEAINHPSKIAVGLGKDNAGRYIVADIAKMPHVLIAGQTGSGKSVCINAIITSILYRATPEEVRLILIDPKVVELSIYNDIPHLVCPVVTDPKKAASALEWAVHEMEMRYKKFAERGVRDIKGYNKELAEGEARMPQMVIIIDELADLMMVAHGEVEDSICRLAQLARACGMHLVIATQRPSVNVITGLIKANIPSRIAFSVSSSTDSRTVIDHGGAEKLLGNGDMLYVPSGINKPMRVQGTWVSDEEIHAVVNYIKSNCSTEYDEDLVEHMQNATRNDVEKEEAANEYDPRLPEAIDIVIDAGQASTSMLQRRMRIGYARAGRMVDIMSQLGIVSQQDGSKPREVLVSREEAHRLAGEEVEA